MADKRRRTDGFQNLYYEKVGLGEGCDCAEKMIDIHEFNRLAGKSRLRTPLWPRKGAWRRFLNKAGLTNRPRR